MTSKRRLSALGCLRNSILYGEDVPDPIAVREKEPSAEKPVTPSRAVADRSPCVDLSKQISASKLLEESISGTVYDVRTVDLHYPGPHGLTLEYGKQSSDQHPAVRAVASHIPDAVNNFRRGDLLVEVNGMAITGMSPDTVESFLQSRPIRLTILRQPLDLSYSLWFPNRHFVPPPEYVGLPEFSHDNLNLPAHDDGMDRGYSTAPASFDRNAKWGSNSLFCNRRTTWMGPGVGKAVPYGNKFGTRQGGSATLKTMGSTFAGHSSSRLGGDPTQMSRTFGGTVRFMRDSTIPPSGDEKRRLDIYTASNTADSDFFDNELFDGPNSGQGRSSSAGLLHPNYQASASSSGLLHPNYQASASSSGFARPSIQMKSSNSSFFCGSESADNLDEWNDRGPRGYSASTDRAQTPTMERTLTDRELDMMKRQNVWGQGVNPRESAQQNGVPLSVI